MHESHQAPLRLVQYLSEEGGRKVAIVEEGGTLVPLKAVDSVYGLAHRAIAEKSTLRALALEFADRQRPEAYEPVRASGRLLTPLDHPVDPGHCLVSGTGLTHIGRGVGRERRLAALAAPNLTAQQEMLRAALENGTQLPDGMPPEWCYKGDGDSLRASECDAELPSFGKDLSDQAEIAALSVIDGAGRPWVVGYALANEFTDHQLESDNVFNMGHAKLRTTGLGPELLAGDLPELVTGKSRVWRADAIVWESAFESGSAVMTHSPSQLLYHHFKYVQFRRPGSVHVHLLGASTTSFTAGIRTQVGDVFEVQSDMFGKNLRNRLTKLTEERIELRSL